MGFPAVIEAFHWTTSLVFSVTVTSHPSYLWAVVTTDDRAERMMDQRRESVSDPPGSPLVGQISDGSQNLFLWAVVCQSNPHSERGRGGWGIPLVLGNVRLKSTLFLNKDLLWDIPKNSHSKADPLSPHHTVLEAGGDGWNEVLDVGKAALAHAPWPIHQEHNVCLHHCPACWESEREKKKESIQIKSFYSQANQQIAVLLYCGSFTVHREARDLHKSPEFLMTQVRRRDYSYSEHSDDKTLVQQWGGRLRIIT